MLEVDLPYMLYFVRYVAPTWVEARGCVLRDGAFTPETLAGFCDGTGYSTSQVEYVVNHVHLWDVLPGSGEDDREALWPIGEVMVRAWEDGLARAFPERRFHVVLEEDYGPTVYATAAA